MVEPVTLEAVLTRQLAPVTAPDALWGRVQNPRPRRSHQNLIWALAAAFVAAVGVWGLHTREEATNEALAVRALAGGPEALEIHSGKMGQIRDWVKMKTGLDIPLPAEPSPLVRVAGACVIKGGRARVSYRVGNHEAALVVSKAASAQVGDGRHRFVSGESRNGVRVSSWIMRGQLYSVACADPGDLQAACLLCHADGERLAAFN